MFLYKLIGYDPETNTYTSGGVVQNLPMPSFTIADSLPADYDLFDAPENWAKYGIQLIGNFFGLREYRALRVQIYTRIEAICGTDYSGWEDLSSEQKQVALEWSNIRIINARGIVFYVTECGSQEAADAYIDAYLARSKKASDLRYYMAFTKYGYQYLGKEQGLKAEQYAREDFLVSTYLERGVVFFADDGIAGLGDWVLGIAGYEVTGLKPRIVSGEFVLGGGLGVNVFCDTLIGILDDGLF